MTTLITGGSGFIGSHVIDNLIERGEDFFNIDMLERRVHGRHPYNKMPKDYMPHLCRDYASIPHIVLTSAERIIHLAAQVGVADSMGDPIRYVRDNTLATAKFLTSLEQVCLNGHKPKKLVVASSMSVYGACGIHVKETAPCNPVSVYGLTKYDQERLCLMWGERLGIPTGALRFFNVYGPRQALNNPYTGVLAGFAKKLLNDEQPIIYEDGQQTRDFIYVTDVAQAVMYATFESATGIYNICRGRQLTIEHIAEVLARALGKDIWPDITHTTRPGDIRHCTGNNGKAMQDDFGFLAKVTFEDGISQYAEWLNDQANNL